MSIELNGYKSFQHPCMLSTLEKPRGGCIVFIRNNLTKYVKSIDKSFNDFLFIHMFKNILICCLYIPPSNSNYFDKHFDILETFTKNENDIILCGDMNARLGELDEVHSFKYQSNPDTEVNQHGKKLLKICKSNHLLPINMLEIKSFPGDFTFKRGNLKSQNDWFITSKNIIENVTDFNYITNLSNISDHIPIQIQINLKTQETLDQIDKSMDSILDPKNNHSRVKKIRIENININVFKNIMNTHIDRINSNLNRFDTETLCSDIENSIHNAAKTSTRKRTPRTNITNGIDGNTVANFTNINNSINDDFKKEYNTWKSILEEKDPKALWRKIDYNGKYNGSNIKPENTCNEFADYLEYRCSLPYEHTKYDDITTNVFDPTLDSHITNEEVLTAAQKMNRKSAARCGISVKILLSIIHPLLNILTFLLNKVFLSTYPKNWIPFIFCLPKKSKLNIPYVRGISIKALLAKLYDSIIKERLQKWTKFLEEQTAYQKGKGCILHVFFVRCLIAICKVIKKPIFVGVTDFEAAFDTISRRTLFLKLVNLGIGMFMLHALIEMYKVADAYILLNGEYSRKLTITAGVLQGSASSTILFIAYTSDVIKIFKEYFPAEELIHCYHILLHADDSLILATSKKSLIEKFRKLDEYCKQNYIRLQLSKCCFLAINSDDKSNIKLDNSIIENKSEFIYLGSTITDSGIISKDLKTEIKQREIKFNKFFAYITQNKNAPLEIKVKMLQSCLLSAILYNCESWGDADLKPLEEKYNQALKYMLGIRKTTCNEFPYIELGLSTLESEIHRRQLKFYKDCWFQKDLPMQRYIIRKALDNNCTFINHYVKLNEKYENPEDVTKQSLQNLKEIVRRKAQENHSKYKTYLSINPSLSKPSFYDRYVPSYKLASTTQLRLVSHNLEIEKGRHNNKLKEERLCKCGSIEDEEHFISNCNRYAHVREKFNELSFLPFHEKLEHYLTPDYVHELTESRKL